MKKSIFAIVFLILASVGTIGLAQSSGWIGTDWITSGALIPATQLESNLGWLEENKVHKPQNCFGDTDRLVWIDGEWGCIQTTIEPLPESTYCDFNGVSVKSGSSVPAYETSSVPFGQTCNQQVRTCTNGNLDGSFTNSSCLVVDPGSCEFNGKSVTHGAQVTAYQASSVAFGQTCQSEQRACTNGNLDGSFTNGSCSVGAPVACAFNSSSVAHGLTTTAYAAESVTSPDSCSSQTRLCTNGNLAGNFGFSSCEVIPTDPNPGPTPPTTSAQCGTAANSCVAPSQYAGGASSGGDGWIYWSCGGTNLIGVSCSKFSPQDR